MHSHGFGSAFAEKRTLSRTTPELEAAGKKSKADLYIAHNLGALPAAVAAARRHSAQAGFDAEDFHSAMDPIEKTTPEDKLAAAIERRFLRSCAYVTAASPGIAKAYSQKYGIPQPETILNVFPLCERPSEFRGGDEGAPLRLYWFSQTIGRDRGLEDAIRALGILRDQTIELHLRGEWCHGYEAEFFELAKSEGIARDRIHYSPPDRPDRMVDLAAHYDVGLALEPRASFNNDVCISNKIFTHLLAGNAIAATKTRGQQTVISRIGRAGFCYEPGSAQQLADGLRKWSEDRQLLADARREAWNWGARQYNWDFEKQKFLGIVERVLTQSGCEAGAASSIVAVTS
jgi:glycosyltransferase involved in cell wall biosynthesis